MIYKLSVVAASTLSRLLGTLLLFALVARAVGPADFGVFAYWYAIGILAAAVSDYGFGQQVLRDLAGAGLPAARARAIGLLVAKGWVSCMVSSVAFIFALVSASGPQESATALLLISAAMIGSVFDYLSMVLRSRAELRTESLWQAACPSEPVLRQVGLHTLMETFWRLPSCCCASAFSSSSYRPEYYLDRFFTFPMHQRAKK